MKLIQRQDYLKEILLEVVIPQILVSNPQTIFFEKSIFLFKIVKNVEGLELIASDIRKKLLIMRWLV